MPNISENSFTGSSLSDPPDRSEIEISLFGPGYGESLLIHVGDNNWLLVDSCIDPINKEPSPLKYLHEIGINPAEAIKLIVVTHWHDDHIRGLAEIFRNCELAEFASSAALQSKEFLTLVYALGRRSMMETSGVHEFYNILEILKERQRSNGGNLVSFKLAIADRLIWKRTLLAAGSNLASEVYSLSPSDASAILALKEIGNFLPKEHQPKTRVEARSPNHVAVVLWIRIGNIYILLGSDLEKTKDLNTGWSIIVDSNTRPQGKACIFKIPHHGSKSADYPYVWTEMLESDLLAVLTPFVLGNVTLPTKSDIERICNRTRNAYSTAFAVRKRTKKRSGIVEKTIRETVKSIREVNVSTGHIRLRTKGFHPPITWKVSLFGDAIPLNKFYAH